MQPGKKNPWDDHYARRAKKENWLARSVYKLEEIDRKYKLLRPGGRILDLGCFPGSWSQYCLSKVGSRGEVVGVDIQKPDHLSAPNFRFIEADILSLDLDWLVQEIGHRDAILSDLAPRTSGIGVTDAARSLSLAERALTIALRALKGGGNFLCKVFEGEDVPAFRAEVVKNFRQNRTLRPAAVRKASREIYVLGLGLLHSEP